MKRVMIAAPGSGSGKTLITCALLRLLKRRGLDITSFKCGPDYIDPMFHRTVLGVPGGNLDSFFSDEDEIRLMIRLLPILSSLNPMKRKRDRSRIST